MISTKDVDINFIIENMKDIICQSDKDGLIQYISPSCMEVLGYDQDSLIGKYIFDLVDEKDKLRIISLFRAGIEKKIDTKVEYRARHLKGHYIWLETSGKVLMESDGEVSGVIFSSRDITERKKLEESKINLEKRVFESEYFLSSTIDNMQGVIYHCQNDDDWTMQYLSKGCYELTGYKPEELINNSITSFGNIVVEKFKNHLMSLTNPVYEHEYEIKTKNGEIKWVLDRGKTIYSEFNQAVRQEGILTDITSIKMLEKELVESKEKLRLVTDNISEVVWLRSADNKNILFVNPAFEDVWGVTCNALYSNPMIFMETIHEEDQELVLSSYTKYLEGKKFDLHYRIVRPDGQIRWINAKTNAARNNDGEVIGHVGSARDITDLKNNEENLEKIVCNLYQKDQYLASIMETQQEMICRFLPDTTLTFVNKAYCKYFKYSEEELIGRKFLELVPETEHSSILNHLKDLGNKKTSISYTQQILDNDNNEIWQEWIDTAIIDSKDEVVEYQSVGRDISYKRKIEKKIASNLDLLEKTQKIAKIGSYEVNLVGETCKSSAFLNELLGIDSSEIHPLDIWPMLIHKEDKERVLHEHNKAIINGTDFDQDYRIIRNNDGVEIWVNDKGNIELGEDGRPSKMNGTIMDITSQKQLINKLNLLNQKITQAYDSTIEGWAHALEMKEEETKEHSIRVTELTLRIAKKLKINEENLIHIKRGAILHDIGKMAIPDSILLKPGKLDENEWKIMKKHPEYAFEMLSNIEYLKPALEIPYCHHEKWDGTGYPRGLKREEIPLSARIFSVVDVFDALTSERPYKKAWDKEKALNLISESSGSHFDPQVVDVFIELISNFY